MRISLAGLGGAAVHGHLPALRLLQEEGQLQLVAVADRAPEALRMAPPGVPSFECVETMIDSVDSDLLVIATEPAAHASLIELGLGRGLQVLCEKPLALTASDYESIRTHAEAMPGRALITLHQYRCSSMWKRLAPCLRLVNGLRLPYEVSVDERRPGADDPYAASPWRRRISSSGGMLADHGSHFLSLAWTIDPAISVESACRDAEGGKERSAALLRSGSGVLELSMSAASPRRESLLGLRTSLFRAHWHRDHAEMRVADRRIASWRTGALSDRRYLDFLYVAFYRDLVQKLGQPDWRSRRRAESLDVGRVLIEMLERADGSASVAPERRVGETLGPAAGVVEADGWKQGPP